MSSIYSLCKQTDSNAAAAAPTGIFFLDDNCKDADKLYDEYVKFANPASNLPVHRHPTVDFKSAEDFSFTAQQGKWDHKGYTMVHAAVTDGEIRSVILTPRNDATSPSSLVTFRSYMGDKYIENTPLSIRVDQ